MVNLLIIKFQIIFLIIACFFYLFRPLVNALMEWWRVVQIVAENATRRVVFRVVTINILEGWFVYASPQELFWLTDENKFNHNEKKIKKTF